MTSPYDDKPKRLFACIASDNSGNIQCESYCVGFELGHWRSDSYADHMMEWLADYALHEDELRVSHVNMYVRLKEAAARIYTSKNYQSRGEIGEISLHAICRDFFGTIPFAPRVFYLTSSNDVVKSFDMVHVRYISDEELELWLGEAKFYKSSVDAIDAAIDSVEKHIDQGFLKNQKLILGPQVSKNVPRYDEIRDLLSTQTSIDDLFRTAVFPICIAADSDAAAEYAHSSPEYHDRVKQELDKLAAKLEKTSLPKKIRILLIYIPLESKDDLAKLFDDRLKGVLK